MQTIVAQLETAFRKAIASAFDRIEADPLINVAQNDKFGDYQANAAMGLAKVLAEKTGQKTNPRQVAEQIKTKLDLGEIASAGDITIAGPGFINVRLAPAWLNAQMQSRAAHARLGVEKTAHPQTVVVDYSGPNIAKELHVGHLRSTIIGDALVRILDFHGDTVIRQNHIGDWGTQFGMLLANLQDKISGSSAIEIKDLEAFYVEAKKRFDVEPDFQKRARENVVRLQSGDAATLTLWKGLIDTTRAHYLPLYHRLGVLLTPDDERGESFYNNQLAAVVTDLRAAGIAEESDGATVVFTDGKDKSPLIIEKTGGGFLYGTTDLAAIRFRVSTLHATRVIYLVDARQSQHFAQVFATAKRAGWAQHATLEHAAFGTMLGEDGKPFATKKGGTAKLKDLLDEAEDRGYQMAHTKDVERVAKAIDRGETNVEPLPELQVRAIAKAIGIGGVKYSDLSKDRTSDYAFSFDKMLSLDGNTAPYLQYAYARIRSIFRRAAERGIQQAGNAIQLESPYELALAKHILRLGEVLQLVARELKPHHLCAYLYDLATRFSGFFENCPVLTSEDPVRSSRLALCDLTARTMGLGLELLGIAHPEQM